MSKYRLFYSLFRGDGDMEEGICCDKGPLRPTQNPMYAPAQLLVLWDNDQMNKMCEGHEKLQL